MKWCGPAPGPRAKPPVFAASWVLSDWACLCKIHCAWHVVVLLSFFGGLFSFSRGLQKQSLFATIPRVVK